MLLFFMGICIIMKVTESEPLQQEQTEVIKMFIRLYDNDERDLYIQLADEMIRLMAEGELREGDELPSIRRLATSLHVNMKTVQAAYQKLADEGFILQRKKATALVNQEHFDEDKWTEHWRKIFTRFQNECKARSLSDDEIAEAVNRLLRKESTT